MYLIYCESYVYICAHTNDLDQGMVLWGFWFCNSCDN